QANEFQVLEVPLSPPPLQLAYVCLNSRKARLPLSLPSLRIRRETQRAARSVDVSEVENAWDRIRNHDHDLGSVTGIIDRLLRPGDGLFEGIQLLIRREKAVQKAQPIPPRRRLASPRRRAVLLPVGAIERQEEKCIEEPVFPVGDLQLPRILTGRVGHVRQCLSDQP